MNGVRRKFPRQEVTRCRDTRRTTVLANVLVALLLAGISSAWDAGAMSIRFSGDGIEQDGFETGILSISVSMEFESTEVRFCDPPEVMYGDGAVAIRIRMREGGDVPDGCQTAFLRPPVPGAHLVHVFLENAAGVVIEQGTATVTVLPPDSRCNPYPLSTPTFYGLVEAGTAAARVAQLTADARLAELASGPVAVWDMGTTTSLGEEDGGVALPAQDWVRIAVALPPLRDISSALSHVASAYSWISWDSWNWWGPGHALYGWKPACEGTEDRHSTIVEYTNPLTGSFFYTGDTGEMATIDADAAGPWRRTGLAFAAVTRTACPGNRGQNVVYRFWGGPDGTPGSHFFTRNRSECQAAVKAGGWTFEGVAFWSQPVNRDGSCGGLVPLHRLWRPFGESVHRLTADRNVVADMVAADWVNEGPVMCVTRSP